MLRTLRGCVLISPYHISELGPLASCTRLKRLSLNSSQVTDLSSLASMPLLEELQITKQYGHPSIRDISPLIQCSNIKILHLSGHHEIRDLNPLCLMVHMTHLFLREACVEDLALLSVCKSLEVLDISKCSMITSLASLTALTSLRSLTCSGIKWQVSLLCLSSCKRLKDLVCSENASGLDDLKRRLPELSANADWW